MSIEIKAYKCEKCKKIYEEKNRADNCCKCMGCKKYIGKFDRKFHWIHCSAGYHCDSFSSHGRDGKYSLFEKEGD